MIAGDKDNKVDSIDKIVAGADNVQRITSSIQAKRENIYTDILDVIKCNYEFRLYKNDKFKSIVFWSIGAMLVAIVASLLVVIIVAVCFQIDNTLGVVISAGTAMLGSVISVVTIITRYLFPLEEDKNMNELIKIFITHDDEK